MQILKTYNGVAHLYDTDDEDFMVQLEVPLQLLGDHYPYLHHTHATTDYDFLLLFFNEDHPIFFNFESSFYWKYTS
jgi:hypothetical protein